MQQDEPATKGKTSYKEMAERAKRAAAQQRPPAPGLLSAVPEPAPSSPRASTAPTAVSVPPPARSRNVGPLAGAAVALVGIAAAALVVHRGAPPAVASAAPAQPPAAVATERAALPAPAPQDPPAAAIPERAPEAAPQPTTTGPEVAAQSKASAPTSPRSAGKIPAAASGLPDEPPVASVQAAIRGQAAAAKGCVAGADDVSRAQITFASNGSVRGVTVSGWAASNGASSCVKQAFQGIRVEPFGRPSYVVGAVVRP